MLSLKRVDSPADCFGEERIIELNDTPGRTIIRIKGYDARFCGKLIFNLIKQPPITGTPSVDALLHIAYNEITVMMTNTLKKKLLKVSPLRNTCVLKLINHDMLD